MTNRNRGGTNVKIETVIENCRSEGKWQKVIELAEELKVGSPSNYGKKISFNIHIYTNRKITIFRKNRVSVEFPGRRR